MHATIIYSLFEVMDSKKENLVHFESYFCTLAMLRRNNSEEISKCEKHVCVCVCVNVLLTAFLLEWTGN
jgi:hypothetical protein